MKSENSTSTLHDLSTALSVALLFSASYFFVWNRVFGLFVLLLALLLFCRFLYQKKYFTSFWVIIFLVLLQNVLYGFFSVLFEKIVGPEIAVQRLVANKYWSYVMLEGKLLFVGVWCVWLFFQDIMSFLKTKKISAVRTAVYLLALLLPLISLITLDKFSMGVLTNTRNYLSLLSVILLGSFLGQDVSNQLTAYFPRIIAIPGTLGLAFFGILSDILLRWNINRWNEIFGVNYLYFAKLFFATATPVYMTAGRFFTDILGSRLPRSGGIYFEPVNYGFVLVFLTILCGYYYFQTKKNIDLITFLLSGFLMVSNLGKGALLTAAMIALVYIFMKVFNARRRKIFLLSFNSILAFIIGITLIAPLISSSTTGHLDPFVLFLEYISHNLGVLVLGNGIGTSGNFISTATFVESAFVVVISEVGIIWYLLYQSIVVGLAYKAFTQTKIHPLIASFAVVGLLNVLIAGTFQENVFSLQIGTFTVLLGTIIASSSPLEQAPRI